MKLHQFAMPLAGCLISLCLVTSAEAYPVGPPLTIEQLVEKSDFICKAVAVSSKRVDDPWFEKHSGFDATQTELKIVAVYKGDKLTRATFRHYAENLRGPMMYSPQHYEFAAGRTYLIFAAKTDVAAEFRQITKSHTMLEDQGQLLAADNTPHAGKAIKEIFWLELTALLNSQQPEDIKYGIRHLNRMSDGLGWKEPIEFPRDDVLTRLLPLLSHKDASVADEAIGALSSNNPMMRQDYAPGWLATIGKGHIPGYGSWDTTKLNMGGKRYWKELAAFADSQVGAQPRSLAILALGRAETPDIRPLALRWIEDPDPQVAAAATLLLSDYLEPADTQLLTRLAADERGPVRRCTAVAIGYGQVKSLIPLLGKLLNDLDKSVAAAAALSLLSFSLDDSEVTLKANLKEPNFGPLFVNALAQRYGLTYADELCDIVQNNRQPQNWWGGFVVWGDSWNVLFKAAQSATKAELSGKDFTKVLAALEAPASGDPQAPTYYSSSEPRDLYALYLQKDMPEHAKEFRAKAQKSIRYDIDYYFKQVDQNPGLYVRGR